MKTTKKTKAPKQKEKIFKCAMCGLVFKSDWSDEEAKKEAEFYFGKSIDEWECEAMVVCDDCFNKIHPKDHPKEVEKTKKTIITWAQTF